MLDMAIAQVEQELARARTELELARQVETVAEAKFYGLLEELVLLCKAKKRSGRALVTRENETSVTARNNNGTSK